VWPRGEAGGMRPLDATVLEVGKLVKNSICFLCCLIRCFCVCNMEQSFVLLFDLFLVGASCSGWPISV
jgi:hypothetical protein